MIDIVGPVARNELATRGDLVGVRLEMAGLHTEMAELKAQMGQLKAEMGALRSEVKTDIAELRHDLTRSFASWLFVSQGVLVTIVGLLVSMR
jgi:hypothetical protein